MPSRVPAILRAQWKTFWNIRPASGRAGRIAAGILWCLWYGMWAFLGFSAALYASETGLVSLALTIPWVLLGISLFWQLTPVLTANLGAAIEPRKLLMYPIPNGELFQVDLFVRLSTAIEMLLVLGGLAIGLLRNPAVPHGAAMAALLLFTAFNAFAAVGLRNLLERLLRIRHVREAVALLMVLCAALPQLLTRTGLPARLHRFQLVRPHELLPSTAAGHLITGSSVAVPTAILIAWTAAAYVFARWQFRRSLTFDSTAAHTYGTPAPGRGRWTDLVFRLPGLLLTDPLAAIVEKELRSLARSPRFRILFFMGFSFGMIIWWPVLGHSGPPGPGHAGYPVIVSGYALVLLAEIVFWNQFGFDRSAAQIYFFVPVPFSSVLRAKNLAALGCAVCEVSAVIVVCAILRVPLPPEQIFETYAVTLVLALYALAAGNISSVHQPRPIDPEQSWGRSSAGRFQLYMLVLFPVLLAPLALAYLAAWAFSSRAAFYVVLAFDALAGVAAYTVATSSAIEAAARRKEDFLAALGQTSGPIATE